MKVRFLDVCLLEIEEALRWYEDQSVELPDRMLSEISLSVEKLRPFPEAFHMVIPPWRRIKLGKFPYSFFFRVSPGEVLIAAFFHQHSDPLKWESLLKDR